MGEQRKFQLRLPKKREDGLHCDGSRKDESAMKLRVSASFETVQEFPILPLVQHDSLPEPCFMNFDDFEQERRFRQLWESVTIARAVPYSLFTFGSSDLPYYLIVDSEQPNHPVQLTRGTVKVTRPLIITPHNADPEFRNFFEEGETAGIIDFLISRTAAFSNLRIENELQKSDWVSDSVEDVVARLNQKLDAEDEDRIAILTAPARLGHLAVLKYTTQRMIESAPGNIQELREKGFLPGN